MKQREKKEKYQQGGTEN